MNKSDPSATFFRNPFAAVVAPVLLVILLAAVVGDRFGMHDFEVYYSASRAFLHGNQVYGTAFGLSSGFFKYAPVTLLFFAPFACLPFMVAKVLFFLIVSAVSLITYQFLDTTIARHFFPGRGKSPYWILFLALLITGAHLHRELELGNVNMMLLLLFSFAFTRLEKGKDIQAGMMMAAGALLKIHFLVLLPLLLLRRRFLTASVFLGTFLCGLALSFLLPDGAGCNTLNHQWLEAVRMHNQSVLLYPDTLYALLYNGFARYFIPVSAGQGFAATVALLAGGGFLLLMRSNWLAERKVQITEGVSSPYFCFEYFLLVAAIPSLTPTDTEHFLFALPLILMVIRYLFERQQFSVLVLFSLCCLFSYSDFGNDVLGRNLSLWLEIHGFTGIGNLLVLISGLIIFGKLKNPFYLPGLK